MRMHRSIVVFLVLVLTTVGCAAAGASSKSRGEKRLWRYIGLGAGAYSGVGIGWLVSDDDAVNSTRKAVRNMVIGGIAGGVGGYFLGRSIDRRQCPGRPVDPIVRSQFLDRFVDEETAKLRSLLGGPPPRPPRQIDPLPGQPVPKTVVPTMK